jgi:hypothetical protein
MSGTTFLMKGASGVRYHGAYSRTTLEIRGTWRMSGPQPVGDDGGVPDLVHQVFEQFPKVQRIALSYEGGGVVFSRMEPAEADASAAGVAPAEGGQQS